jgi:hypothetical protein
LVRVDQGFQNLPGLLAEPHHLVLLRQAMAVVVAL